MNRNIITLLFIITIMTTGCTNSTDITGTYVSSDNPEHSLTLLDDGTHILKMDSIYSGDYKIVDNIVYLEITLYHPEPFIIESGYLVDDEGYQWKKQ